MTYDDNSPERRNLVVTSLAFIVFALGGGEVVNGSVSLQMANIEFTNKDFLITFAWIALFWFLYRYWLMRPENLKAVLDNEFSGELLKNEKFQNYIRKNIDSPGDGLQVKAQKVFFRKHKVIVIYDYQHSSSQGVYAACDMEHRVSGFWMNLYIFLFRFKAGFVKPAFSTHVVPYFLFFLALITNLWGMLLS